MCEPRSHETWVCYSYLLNNHGVRRGWLDKMVFMGVVRLHPENQRLYNWADVEEALAEETVRGFEGEKTLEEDRWTKRDLWRSMMPVRRK